MVVTDPIADFLTRIRNANMVNMDKVEIPASGTKRSMAEILKEEGFVKDVEYIEDGKQGVIRVYLKYTPDRGKVITPCLPSSIFKIHSRSWKSNHRFETYF